MRSLWKNNGKYSFRLFFFQNLSSIEKQQQKKNSYSFFHILIKLSISSNFMRLQSKITSEICQIGNPTYRGVATVDQFEQTAPGARTSGAQNFNE